MSDPSLRRYYDLHQIEARKRLDQETSPVHPELTELLVQDLDRMTPEEQRCHLQKTLNDRQVYQMLLEYEFWNRTLYPQEWDFERTLQEAQRLLRRYQWKAGGFQMGSSEWEEQRSETRSFKVPHNQVWFTNTVPIQHQEAEQLYLNRLQHLLNQLSHQVEVSFKTHVYKRDAMTMLVFVFKDLTDESTSLVIGL